MNALHLRIFAGLLTLAQLTLTQTPEWIWHGNNGKPPGNNERRFFRKTFTLPAKPAKAVLAASVDNEGTAFVNGKSVGTVLAWEQAVLADVTGELVAGENLLAVRGINHGGSAGVVARLEVTFADGKKQTIVSDTSWLTHTEESAGWQQLTFK